MTETKRSRGRPRVGSKNVGVRFPPNELQQLDDYIKTNDLKGTRQEVIRAIVAEKIESAKKQ